MAGLPVLTVSLGHDVRDRSGALALLGRAVELAIEPRLETYWPAMRAVLTCLLELGLHKADLPGALYEQRAVDMAPLGQHMQAAAAADAAVRRSYDLLAGGKLRGVVEALQPQWVELHQVEHCRKFALLRVDRLAALLTPPAGGQPGAAAAVAGASAQLTAVSPTRAAPPAVEAASEGGIAVDIPPGSLGALKSNTRAQVVYALTTIIDRKLTGDSGAANLRRFSLGLLLRLGLAHRGGTLYEQRPVKISAAQAALPGVLQARPHAEAMLAAYAQLGSRLRAVLQEPGTAAWVQLSRDGAGKECALLRVDALLASGRQPQKRAPPAPHAAAAQQAGHGSGVGAPAGGGGPAGTAADAAGASKAPQHAVDVEVANQGGITVEVSPEALGCKSVETPRKVMWSFSNAIHARLVTGYSSTALLQRFALAFLLRAGLRHRGGALYEQQPVEIVSAQRALAEAMRASKHAAEMLAAYAQFGSSLWAVLQAPVAAAWVQLSRQGGEKEYALLRVDALLSTHQPPQRVQQDGGDHSVLRVPAGGSEQPAAAAAAVPPAVGAEAATAEAIPMPVPLGASGAAEGPLVSGSVSSPAPPPPPPAELQPTAQAAAGPEAAAGAAEQGPDAHNTLASLLGGSSSTAPASPDWTAAGQPPTPAVLLIGSGSGPGGGGAYLLNVQGLAGPEWEAVSAQLGRALAGVASMPQQSHPQEVCITAPASGSADVGRQPAGGFGAAASQPAAAVGGKGAWEGAALSAPLQVSWCELQFEGEQHMPRYTPLAPDALSSALAAVAGGAEEEAAVVMPLVRLFPPGLQVSILGELNLPAAGPAQSTAAAGTASTRGSSSGGGSGEAACPEGRGSSPEDLPGGGGGSPAASASGSECSGAGSAADLVSQEQAADGGSGPHGEQPRCRSPSGVVASGGGPAKGGAFRRLHSISVRQGWPPVLHLCDGSWLELGAEFRLEAAISLLATATSRSADAIQARLAAGAAVGLPGSLHSVYAALGWEGGISSLTYRARRHIPGLAALVLDCLAELGRSSGGHVGGGSSALLVLGAGEEARTSLLRDCARVLTETFRLRVAVVDDACGSLGGATEEACQALGRACRLVPFAAAPAHRLLLDAAARHGAQVVVAAEGLLEGCTAEEAASTLAAMQQLLCRGVPLVVGLPCTSFVALRQQHPARSAFCAGWPGMLPSAAARDAQPPALLTLAAVEVAGKEEVVIHRPGPAETLLTHLASGQAHSRSLRTERRKLGPGNSVLAALPDSPAPPVCSAAAQARPAPQQAQAPPGAPALGSSPAPEVAEAPPAAAAMGQPLPAAEAAGVQGEGSGSADAAGTVASAPARFWLDELLELEEQLEL